MLGLTNPSAEDNKGDDDKEEESEDEFLSPTEHGRRVSNAAAAAAATSAPATAGAAAGLPRPAKRRVTDELEETQRLYRTAEEVSRLSTDDVRCVPAQEVGVPPRGATATQPARG